jgi:hypothetical protein
MAESERVFELVVPFRGRMSQNQRQGGIAAIADDNHCVGNTVS